MTVKASDLIFEEVTGDDLEFEDVEEEGPGLGQALFPSTAETLKKDYQPRQAPVTFSPGGAGFPGPTQKVGEVTLSPEEQRRGDTPLSVVDDVSTAGARAIGTAAGQLGITSATGGEKKGILESMADKNTSVLRRPKELVAATMAKDFANLKDKDRSMLQKFGDAVLLALEGAGYLGLSIIEDPVDPALAAKLAAKSGKGVVKSITKSLASPTDLDPTDLAKDKFGFRNLPSTAAREKFGAPDASRELYEKQLQMKPATEGIAVAPVKENLLETQKTILETKAGKKSGLQDVRDIKAQEAIVGERLNQPREYAEAMIGQKFKESEAQSLYKEIPKEKALPGSGAVTTKLGADLTEAQAKKKVREYMQTKFSRAHTSRILKQIDDQVKAGGMGKDYYKHYLSTHDLPTQAEFFEIAGQKIPMVGSGENTRNILVKDAESLLKGVGFEGAVTGNEKAGGKLIETMQKSITDFANASTVEDMLEQRRNFDEAVEIFKKDMPKAARMDRNKRLIVSMYGKINERIGESFKTYLPEDMATELQDVWLKGKEQFANNIKIVDQARKLEDVIKPAETYLSSVNAKPKFFMDLAERAKTTPELKPLLDEYKGMYFDAFTKAIYNPDNYAVSPAKFARQWETIPKEIKAQIFEANDIAKLDQAAKALRSNKTIREFNPSGSGILLGQVQEAQGVRQAIQNTLLGWMYRKKARYYMETGNVPTFANLLRVGTKSKVKDLQKAMEAAENAGAREIAQARLAQAVAKELDRLSNETKGESEGEDEKE